MKIAVTMASVSRAAGGIFSAERRLCQELAALGADIRVFAVRDEYSDRDAPGWAPVHPSCFPVAWPRTFARGAGMSAALMDCDADILHTKGLWLYPSVAALRWRRRTRRPYLVSPHGMLDPWALGNSRWKKRVARILYEDCHVKGAACLHAVSRSEARSIRELGFRNPVCVIPSGVDIPAVPTGVPPPWNGFLERGKKVLLYLGRLHPKKGLGELFRAWKRVEGGGPNHYKDWALVVAGWGDRSHEASYRSMVEDLGLSNVHFAGPLHGEEKEAALENADAFILPSFSEGLPLAVLEAWAHGLLVVMTKECNIPEGFNAGAAIRVDADVSSIIRGLRLLFEMNDDQRRGMGGKGLALVRERFTWRKISGEMKEAYDWILGGGMQPETVVLNGQDGMRS